MAKSKSHKSNGEYTNPEVRFEREDIEAGSVVRFGVALTVVLIVASTLAIWVAVVLTRSENRIKDSTLPKASVDANRLPPEPRLEALEDVRQNKRTVIFPPRAREYPGYEKQKREVETEVAAAIGALAGRLPARTGRMAEPPSSFGITLPSKAASGRVETGGQ